MRWSPIRTGVGVAPPSPASYEACDRSSGGDLLDAGGAAALVDQVEDRLLELWLVDRQLAAGDGALAARLRPRHLAGHREADGREHGGVPRPEVLRGVALAGDLLDVLVDVARADVRPAAPCLVGEQLVAPAAAALELAHDVDRQRVDDGPYLPLARLGDVVEDHRVPVLELHVRLAHRRQAEALVGHGVLLRPD